jgi:hypothetical protein
VDEATRAEVHAVLFLALAPERHADVADAHRLRDLRSPALFELRPEGRLAAARLTRDENSLDAGRPEVVVLGEIRRVGRRKHGGPGAEQLDRLDQAVGVPGADRYVGEADPVKGSERGARDERPGVVGRDDALAGGNPGRRVASRRAGHPVVEVSGRQWDVTRRAGGPARRIDPDDLRRLNAEMRADRVLRRRGFPKLPLLGHGELRYVGEAASLEPLQLLAIKR